MAVCPVPSLVISGEHDPQAWNGYAYVRNNPLRFTDPTGKRRNDVEDAAKDQHDLVWALRALAAARDAAAQAQEWATAVPEPAPPCYNCAKTAWDAAVSSSACSDPRACSAILAVGPAGGALPWPGTSAGGAVPWGAIASGFLRLAAEAPKVTLAGLIILSAFIPDAPARAVVIGETMERVNRFAASVPGGADTFVVEATQHDPREGALMNLNRKWIEAMMGQRRIIYDIEIDPNRDERSPYYAMEAEATRNYDLLRPIHGY